MKLNILDTGYVGLELDRGSQTQLTRVNRAGRYTGGGDTVKAITLNVSGLSVTRNTNTEAKPIPGTYTDSQTTLVSNSNRVINVSCVLQKEIVTTEYDYGELYQLMRMEETEGLKLIYPSAVTDPTGFKTIIESMGKPNINDTTKFSAAIPYEDEGTVSTTTPYVIGRIKAISVNDGPNSDYWKITFRFEVSG